MLYSMFQNKVNFIIDYTFIELRNSVNDESGSNSSYQIVVLKQNHQILKASKSCIWCIR